MNKGEMIRTVLIYKFKETIASNEKLQALLSTSNSRGVDITANTLSKKDDFA